MTKPDKKETPSVEPSQLTQRKMKAPQEQNIISTLHPDEMYSILYGDHGAPFSILGLQMHDADDSDENGIVIRAFRPSAKTLTVIHEANQERSPMTRVHEWGFFEVILADKNDDFKYHYEETTHDDVTLTYHDPYNYPFMLTDLDLHLLGEGQHWESYDRMGAHIRTVDGVKGVNFAVWAPNARRVSVVGDFNNWDGRVHVMQRNGGTGIWELFIPGLGEGTVYKYEIKSQFMGYMEKKSDPYGFYSQVRPANASIVADIDSYEWGDQEWMTIRAGSNALIEPYSIYEVHLGSWKRNQHGDWLTYRELADELVDYVKEMGYTHIELMPVAEHPFDGSWGYQVTGYYAPTSRYGTPEDFMYFVDRCHQNGIGIILDWVPAHFPKDGYALSYFDGTHLYSHADPRQGEHPDWGTYIFNYGRNEVRNFLIANALFWLKKYHIDGLRVDAVSSMLYLNFSREDGQWIPNRYGGHENIEAIEFIKKTNELVHEQAPGAVMVAEESTAWPMISRPTYVGGLGYTFKWNMGWMHDTLRYMSKDPIHRRFHHNDLTFSMMYAYTENFVLSLSHDEVVHLKGSLIAKMPGDYWQRFANLRLLFGYQYTHPGKILNFMGQEIAQWQEWSEERGLDWTLLDFEKHRQIQDWVRDLNRFYREQAAMWEKDFEPEGFRWIDANDSDQSIFTYLRFAADPSDFLVVAANFTPIPRRGYRIGVPEYGFYRERLNSDSMYYGGSNMGNDGGVMTAETESHGLPYSLNITIPPLGIVVFKLDREHQG